MAVPLLTSDQIYGSGTFAPQLWGIFDQNGDPIFIADSVAAVQFTRDYQLSTYPQEQGAFETYNKVQVPFQAQIGFLTANTRYDFLNSIEAIAGSLELVSVYTPEIAYPSANIVHYNYRRESRSGVEMIRVEVWVEEVRVWGQDQTQGNGAQNGDSAIAGQNGTSESSAPPSNIGYPTASGDPTVQSNNGSAPQNQGEQAPIVGTPPSASASIPPGSGAPIPPGAGARIPPGSGAIIPPGAGASIPPAVPPLETIPF